MTAITAADLGIPGQFNAAVHFVDRNIHEGLGAKVAIECGGEQVTYANLLERVNRTGAALRAALGVRPEERIVLLLVDGPEFAYSFFGAIKIGAVPVPINTLWKTADLRYVLNDSRARVLIVSHELLPQVESIGRQHLPHLEHRIVVGGRDDSFRPLMDTGSPRLEAETMGRDAAAFWLYSSGSTGAPKGCIHLHHDMVVCAELYAKRTLGIRPTDRFFSAAKLFFAYGLGNALYFPLSVGGTSILWPGPPTAPNIYRIIEAHRPTLFFSVPTNFAMLLAQDGDFDLSSLRLAISAGEALPPALFERFQRRFGVEILDGIGSTETLHMFISNRPGAVRPGSSGRLIEGYGARLLDDRREPVADGEIGNLWIAGDSICAGYWNRHEKSKNTIEGQWIRTGDKFSRDADGFFWYAGRSDDMLKVGGLWVSPVEVENALAEHPAVQECGVVAREDRDELVKPLAFVVLKAGVAGTSALAADLQQHVRARLADYKRPRWIEFIPELPKTATGKIQRFKLRQLARDILTA